MVRRFNSRIPERRQIDQRIEKESKVLNEYKNFIKDVKIFSVTHLDQEEKLKIKSVFELYSNTDSKKTADFFDLLLQHFKEDVGDPKYLENIIEHIDFFNIIFETGHLAPIMERLRLLEYLPSQVILNFVEKVKNVGTDITHLFFVEKMRDFEDNPENSLDIMKEFFLDDPTLQLLAEKRLLQVINTPTQDILELPEHTNENITVELEIPSLKHDPFWFKKMDPWRYKIEKSKDDTSYRLPLELAFFENLDKDIPEDTIFAIKKNIEENDTETALLLLEKIIDKGKIPQETAIFILKSLKTYLRVFSTQELSNPTTKEIELKQKLDNYQKRYSLPRSAEKLTIKNSVLNKTRDIPDFKHILRQKMFKTVLLGTISNARRQNFDIQSFLEEIIQAEAFAVSTYINVHKRGTPIFKDFINFINQEAEKSDDYAGEFYVGRDTYTTMYPAALVYRWKKMRGHDRKKLTVHVNVSRLISEDSQIESILDKNIDITNKEKLTKHLNDTFKTRAMFKKWLEEEGVTRRMLGIDGGYQGSGPETVFKALDPYFSTGKLDKQIKLITSNNKPDRNFNQGKYYQGAVRWMESLPKFTTRAEKLIKSDLGQFYIIDEKTSPVEQLLAWTVRHAVWRELINHEPNETE